MKIKDLIEHLSDFDEEKEIFFCEISDLYDTIFLGVFDRDDKVALKYKVVEKTEKIIQ
jgi:hypothetical protein